MSWTTPKTFTAEVLTSTDMNAQVRDNLNYLKTQIALEVAVELTLDTDGAITKTYSHHTVDTFEDAASDNLVTISGGAEGEVILLRAAHTDRTVVIDTGAGNIINPAGDDISLDSTDKYCLLQHNGTNWIVIGGGLAAHAAAADPHTGYRLESADHTHQSAGAQAGQLDHGLALTGLLDDDHTQYLKEADLLITLGTELAPAMTQANWTEGVGWTINDGAGTATRVAAASTTMVPTSAIVPSTSKKYKLTFTISSWTAGTMTVTLGGVVSSPLSGDQAVMQYVDPFTTGNLIFTPDATFAGVITLVSVKEMTGGEVTIEGDLLHYDSRGHSNRLAHMTRHLSEMATDTLLDKSRSELSCTGGVLTYTLYAYYGAGTWNFNGVVYPASVASASVALTGGSDAVPKANHVYFKLVGNTPTLSVSLDADPTGVHIRVATFIVGAVAGSNYTIYSYHRNRREVDTMINRTINRAILAGTLYDSGALPTVLIGSISVASGGKWLQGIFPLEAANTVTSAAFYYMKQVAGVYNWFAGTALTDLKFYNDGTGIGNHEFANIVWGIVPTTTTALGTLPTTVKLIAVLQTDPTVNYSTLALARQDLYDATNYFPPDSELKKVFLPIARTIISEDNDNEFQTFDTGLYWKDLRGRITSGGGAATSTDTSGLVAKSLYDAYTILMATTDDTPIALTVNAQEVVGRMTGGTIDGIALGIADNNIVQMDDAGPAADNDYAKFTANGLEGRSYSEVRSDLDVMVWAIVFGG
jgi:hypothetical protein